MDRGREAVKQKADRRELGRKGVEGWGLNTGKKVWTSFMNDHLTKRITKAAITTTLN